MKKTPIIVLSLLLALIFLTSCAGDVEVPHTCGEDTAEQTEDGGIFVELAEHVLIADATSYAYTLVRATDANTHIIDCFRSINRKLKEFTGTDHLGSDDWLMPGTDADGRFEILLGNTARAESAEVLDAIGIDDYAIVKVNNKIVIAAHTKDRLSEAVERFVNELLTVEGEGDDLKVFFTENVWVKGNKSALFDAENPLSDYRIVCRQDSTDAMSAATTLQKNLKKAYGTELPIATDDEPETEKEIIVGRCSRPLSQKYLTAPSTDYYIVNEGKQLLIGCNMDYFAKMAVESFCAEYVHPYYSNTLKIERDTIMKETPYSFNETNELTAGSDIRVMSFNVLCELWNDQLPVEGRDQSVVAAIKYFSPDVVGIQEVSDVWYKSFDTLFENEYVFTDKKNENGETNFSTLAYNTAKVRLLEHGTQIFSQGNSPKLRLVTWGYFEKIADGKKFVAVSTHWDLGSNPQFLTVHAEEMAQIVKDLGAKYSCPVVTTGDYNCKESSTYYKTFIEKSGYQDSKYTAAVVNRACVTTHKVGTTPSDKKADCIDHIFGSPEVTFTYYNVLLDKFLIDASDHCAIYADVKLS